MSEHWGLCVAHWRGERWMCSLYEGGGRFLLLYREWGEDETQEMNASLTWVDPGDARAAVRGYAPARADLQAIGWSMALTPGLWSETRPARTS